MLKFFTVVLFVVEYWKKPLNGLFQKWHTLNIFLMIRFVNVDIESIYKPLLLTVYLF